MRKTTKVSQELIDLATPIINKLAKQRKNKHTFAYFESEDIFQEIWLLCLDALERYDPKCGKLENFLSKHLSHRITNLKRDKYFRPEKDPDLSKRTWNRINIINAIPIGHNDISNSSKSTYNSLNQKDPLDVCITIELKEFIINKLPKDMIKNFELLMNGERLKKRILTPLREKLLEIIDEYNVS